MMKGSVQSARQLVSFLLGNVLVDQVRKIGLACLLHDAAPMQQQHINGAECSSSIHFLFEFVGLSQSSFQVCYFINLLTGFQCFVHLLVMKY